MGVSGANIGKARLQVELLSGSPFSGKIRQELAFFLAPDMLKGMESPSNIFALPAEFNGFRLAENIENYDNYLVDWAGNKLSDYSSISAARQVYSEDLTGPSEEQERFFTWITIPGIFLNGVCETIFKNAFAKNDNTPKWEYNQKIKPDDNSSPILSPFMITTPPDQFSPVHWGCCMNYAMPRNQPFSILLYHEGQAASLAPKAASLNCRFSGLIDVTQTIRKRQQTDQANAEQENTKPSTETVPLDLTNRLYLGILVGEGEADNCFFFLFVQGMSPQCYRASKNGPQGWDLSLLSEFSDFSGNKLFDPENSFFTVNFEPISTGVLVTGNRFDGKQWAILGTAQSPVFLGEGRVFIYSGNSQAGFAMRPLQYAPHGQFTTQPQSIRQDPNDTRMPDVTTGLKGSEDIQQQQDKSGQIHAVDAELVNGEFITTFIESESGLKGQNSGTATQANELRRINLLLLPVEGDDATGSETLLPETAPSEREYKVQVDMFSCNVPTQSGFVISNGKSPYIWQFRLELPLEAQGADPTVVEDISCDVLGLELNWNATGYNELTQTGTLKVQNRPRVRKNSYDELARRAVYLRISAWWEGGKGHDPGGEQRRIFEGLTTGPSTETRAEQEVVVFKIEDYTNALEGSKFMNSPYYDGMKASKVVSDIVQMTGLSPARILVGNTPIAQLADDPTEIGLPIGPNPLSQPMYKFEDGSSYKEAIVKVATWDGKAVYFDQFGNFHYDPIPGGVAFDQDTTPVVSLVTSPRSTTDGSLVVWNMSSFSSMVGDVYNILRVGTVDKETGAELYLIGSYEAGISNPSAEGYLGYAKRLDIFEPAIGGVQPLARYFKTYRNRVFLPPLTAKFEMFGYSGLKPLDTISLDGQKLRIVNLSSHFDAKENQYWMTAEGEWYFNSENT